MVLVDCNRTGPWRYCQRQVGWPIYNRLGWQFDSSTTVGSARRLEDSHTGKISIPVLVLLGLTRRSAFGSSTSLPGFLRLS